jgi:hypothetical protein
VRLHPVHPGAAELQVVAEPAIGPGPPADKVTGLQHEHVEPRAAQLARCNETREPGPMTATSAAGPGRDLWTWG